jgi:hypothetical protein
MEMAYESLRGRQISPANLSAEIDISVSQIHRWIGSGKVVATKLGYRQVRIDGNSVADFLEQSRIPAKVAPESGVKRPRHRRQKTSSLELAGQA